MARAKRGAKGRKPRAGTRSIADIGADRLIAASYKRLSAKEAQRRYHDRAIARLTGLIYAERANLMRLLGTSDPGAPGTGRAAGDA